MRILILGGTLFLGRHLVEAALANGHEITLFNRGRTNPDLFPQVNKLTGDRDGGLDALRGRSWDAMIDTSGYLPRNVAASAALLSDSAANYTFISSISVYADFSAPGISEDAAVGTLEDETIEVVDGRTYGPLKALCEGVVQNSMAGRALVIRPGLIVGPHDPRDRFTYWVWRVARGGEILAPADVTAPVQIIDVRDLSAWILALVEEGKTGIYNATGPEHPLTLEQILEHCKAVSGSDARWVCPDRDFLRENEVQPFADLPLWIDDQNFVGFFQIDISKALKDGLVFRPLDETISDTLAWADSRPPDYAWQAGLSRKREGELLRAWPEGGGGGGADPRVAGGAPG